MESSVLYYFNDEKINELVGIDGIRESAIAVVAMKDKNFDHRRECKIDEAKEESTLTQILFPYKSLSESEIKYPTVERMKGLTSFNKVPDYRSNIEKFKKFKEDLKTNVTDFSDSILLPEPDLNESSDIAICIKSRRSSRDYHNKSISKNDLSSILYFSSFSTRSEFEKNEPGFTPQFLDIYIIVNRVEDIQQGIYRYNKKDNSITLIKAGNFIEKSTYVSLGQEIAGRSGVVVILTGNFDGIKILGDRGYRMMHIEAGIFGQNIYLSVTSLGLGCTGIGAFYDDDICDLLGFTNSSDKVIYELIVGLPVPDERLVDKQ